MIKPSHPFELVQAVLVDWRRNETYTQIANRYNISANAVAGIIGRNKMPGEKAQRGFHRSRNLGSSVNLTSSVERLPSVTKRCEKSKKDQKDYVAGFRSCQWISGEPSADDSCKCGEPVVVVGVYCTSHQAMTTRPPRKEFENEPT